MPAEDLLTRLVGYLEARSASYFITGSLASSMQGEPRTSHDVDVVVDLKPEDVASLHDAFPEPRYYLDASAATEAIRLRSSFNIVDAEEGLKADCWLLEPTPFDASRLARRRRDQGPAGDCWVSSPEDTILIKLKWAKRSASERQFMDALRVYEIQHAKLDQSYLVEWSERLEVDELLAHLRREAHPLEP